MDAPLLDDTTRDRLTRISTASLTTALFKRGLRSQVIQGALPVVRKPGNMVGQAFTLRTIPAREDRNPISVFRRENHPQRVAVERCPPRFVMVIDSRKDARAASAGAILVSRLQVRGCAGIVTDGGFRDAEAIGALDMPAFHVRPSAPTNLTLHEAIEFDVPVACGDVLVGDGDGVVVIPIGLAREVAAECAEMESFETFVAQSVREGWPVIGLYPPTREETVQRYERWRESQAKGKGPAG